MDAARAKKWMQLFNEKIQDQKAYLSDLDTPIGDGDHGGNMARGMAAAVESLAARDFASAAEVFQAVSMQLISKVGGASGPLYGSAFMGMAKAEKDGKDWVELGVTQAIYHRSRDAELAGKGWTAEDIELMKKLSDLGLQLSITGGIVPEDIHLFKEIKNAKAFIAGRALVGEKGRATAEAIRAEIAKYWA